MIKKRMYNIMIKETNDGDWFKRLDEEVEQKRGMTPNAVASSFLQTSSTFKQRGIIPCSFRQEWFKCSN